MVRVIEKAASKQCTCSQCKSKLEYEYCDMLFSFESDYGGGRDHVARINCPMCGNKTKVSVIF